MVEWKNFSGQTTPSIVDLEYKHCNFMQPQCTERNGKKVGIRLFPGDDTPRTFIRCNLSNCELPPGSTTTRCNQTIAEKDVLHSTEIISIDGVTIEAKTYKMVIYGRIRDGVYQYKPIPTEVISRRKG